MIRDFTEQLELAARIALFLAAISAGVVILLAGTKAAMAASLRPETIISGDYIKLGDIFQDVKNADYILGPAPQPGQEMILNARTLYRIATSMNVRWAPATSAEQIVLRREATYVPESEINAAIESRLRDNGLDSKFTVNYMNAPETIILPAGSDASVEITAFNYDPQNDSFNAVLVAPSADKPLRRITASGRIERLVSVPVLKNTLRAGDIIGAMDIDYIDMPQSRVSNGMVTDAEGLVNMTPRRPIQAGKPVALNELERPKMVDRGDMITLIFAEGPMRLTVQGKSMQAGALGDIVRVSNLSSNKNLQGTVTGDREVTIH
ncbi:MAG: flagellar basal body P-ring formation chaperone FlgA [Micavibrio sp.]